MEPDRYKEEIQELYINQGKTLKDVIRHLQEEHSCRIKPGALKNKLKAWGYTKNVTRSQAFALVRGAARNRSQWHDSLDFQEQPARAVNLERYLRRNKISFVGNTSVPSSLASAPMWRVPEQIFHDNVAFITSSFESSHWISAGDELIITSSPNQNTDRTALHHFLGQLEMASKAVASGRWQTAGEHWRQAFGTVDSLVTGQYHDTLPNVLQKINDLKAEGHAAVATKLQNHLAASSSAHKARGPTPAIFQSLRLVHLDDLIDIEEQVMRIYVDLFDQFLGLRHYNSFVMRMNLARRQLLRNPVARLEDHIPSLALFDGLFGLCDRRCLDIIRLRVEISHQRDDHVQIEIEAPLLIERASLKVDDPWQRQYFLIKGYYYLGLAQCMQGKRECAKVNMLQGIKYIHEFSALDEHDIFGPELAILEDCLQDPADAPQQRTALSTF